MIKYLVKLALPVRVKESGQSPVYVTVAEFNVDLGLQVNELIFIDGFELGEKRFSFSAVVMKLMKRVIATGKGTFEIIACVNSVEPFIWPEMAKHIGSKIALSNIEIDETSFAQVDTSVIQSQLAALTSPPN